MIAALDDGVLLVDPDLRVLACNPALAHRVPLRALCDGRGQLRVPALARLARDALGGADRTVARVDFDPVEGGTGPIATRPSGPATDQTTPAPPGPRWSPVVRAIGLGDPVRACALILRDPAPAGETGSARELITTLSHELKSPLFHAQQAVEFLTQYHVPEDSEFGAAVDRAAWSVRHITAVVRDLTDLLHLDDPRRLTLRRELVDVAELARAVGETYEGLAAARGVELELAIDPAPLPPLGLDTAMITRALGNLLDNALKYAPAPGPVTLRVRRAGSLLNLEVADRGPGIDPADQRRIFDPFVRLPAAATLTGSGLGLALAHRIARAHGGTLTLESSPGAGATFRLSLLLPPGA